MIDKKVTAHIAKLARLEMSEQEAEVYGAQLSKALQHFDQISKIKTDGVEPLVTPSEINAFWRHDEVVQEFNAEKLTENAPDRLGALFKVPPVV